MLFSPLDLSQDDRDESGWNAGSLISGLIPDHGSKVYHSKKAWSTSSTPIEEAIPHPALSLKGCFYPLLIVFIFPCGKVNDD